MSRFTAPALAWALLTLASAAPSPGTAPEAEELSALIHQHSRALSQLGFLGRHKAADGRLRRLGDRLARDHELIDQALLSLAERRHLIPASLPRDPRSTEDIRALERLTGAAFDRRYIEAVARGQRRLVARLEKGCSSLQDREVETFVARVLELAREHEELATRLEDEG